jgi:hypothetical protein
MKKLLTILSCKQCDNFRFDGWPPFCMALNRDLDGWDFPTDCPLPTSETADTGFRLAHYTVPT